MLKTVLRCNKNVYNSFRYLSVAQPKENVDRMKSWQVHSYGEDLQCCQTRIPIIQKPSELLVNINAASVNPIDVAMKDGYGETVLKLFKCQDLVMPLTLGRDFAGVIVDKGHGIDDKFQIGDKIYGVIPFYKNGSHAELAIVDQAHVCHLPKDILSDIEAASLPYTALTAWSALWVTGGLLFKRVTGIKVLILGASGGVGISAVQMLKATEACVFATCSTDAIPLVQSLGADCVLDYRDPDYLRNVAAQGRYDIILDCAQFGHHSIPSSWQFSSYITLNSPLLHNTDKYGLLGGLALSVSDLIPANIKSLSTGSLVKWAYFYPSEDGMKFVDKLVRKGQLSPIIDKVYSFNETQEAYNRIKAGHLRGKVVINMESV